MSSYLFVFGRTPGLALEELRSVAQNVLSVSPSVALADIVEDPPIAIARLGGTVKIAQSIRVVSQLSAEVFAEILAQDDTSAKRRMDFGISYYDTPPDAHILPRVKEILADQGISARFVAAKHESALSSVVVAKQQIVELIVTPAKGEGYMIAKTVAVQDFEEWNRRDYGRPAADPKAGMLPPKVARMVVNIALLGGKGMLLDPFCGMGTILAEALLSGADVLGSDAAPRAAAAAEKNLAWLISACPAVKAASWKLFVADATHVSDHLEKESVDAIATEPFMGTTQLGGQGAPIPSKRLHNIIKGLEKLYIGCLRDWQHVLRTGGRIVIAMPEYRVGTQKYFVKKVIDSCERLGYTCLAGPIEYSRPQAVVRRQFFIFQKK